MSFRIALAGNPNCGKTTLFNKLTGANQRVGNWPGVTVDRKEGKIRGTDAELIDMPGIYSLSPYSPEEVVTRNYLINENPDAVINIVDATNLNRNLFLTLQVIDTGLPTVIALNMMDTIEKEGSKIDVDALSQKLGCPVVPISALKGTGVDNLVQKTMEIAGNKVCPAPLKFSAEIEEAIDAASAALKGKVDDGDLRWTAVKIVEKDEMVLEQYPEAVKNAEAAIAKLEESQDDSSDAVIADARYNLIGEIVDGSVSIKPKGEKGTLSDRVDRIVTHRIWGLPIFIAIIGALFFLVIGFSIGEWEGFIGIGTICTDITNGWIEESVQPFFEEWCNNIGASAAVTDLLVNGIVAGVGAVIGFLPQMLFMFLAICILEDIGYMARVAFVMDRIFRYFGLSGKSFIPALVGIGCGVPAVMASRTIESERDRRITAMTVTFMPCSAKIPVIAMIAGALFGNSGLIALFVFVLGIFTMLMSGIILKKWKKLSGEPAPFIMELPPYHLPTIYNLVKGTLDRGWAFVKRAGSLILLSSILIWALSSYGMVDGVFGYLGEDVGSEESILGAFGKLVCGIFMPLGWEGNWELTVGTITGLMAKENVVATFGVLFNVPEELVGDNGEGLWVILHDLITPAAGLGFLVFNMLCAPCFAAIGAMHRELGTWRDTGVAVGYQCLIAYVLADIVYVIYSLIAGSKVEMVGVVLCILFIAALAYILISKDPFKQFGDKQVA